MRDPNFITKKEQITNARIIKIIKEAKFKDMPETTFINLSNTIIVDY